MSRERLVETLRSLPTKRSAVGDIEHQQGLVRTEELLEKVLREFGHEPRRQAIRWNLNEQRETNARAEERAKEKGARFQPVPIPETTPELAGHQWVNLIVDLPGRERPKEVLIIGAHFDAVPGSPGADDNGTGTVALLEAARVLKGVHMKRTVRLIFFNLEEIGLKGAAEYVRTNRRMLLAEADPQKPEAEVVVGMVSLEMLGFYCTTPGCQKSPIPPIKDVFDPPTVGDQIVLATTSRVRPFNERLEREILAADPLNKVFRVDFAPIALPDLLRSDHAPFLAAGLPAVMMTDTANFRNPHYHKPTDTIETLDLERYTAMVRGVVRAIHQIAEPAE